MLKVLISALVANTVFCSDQARTNPYLAQGSQWPIAHQNPWNTDSTPQVGPKSDQVNHQLLYNGILNIYKYLDPITILFTEDDKYFWASSMTGIFKVRVDEDKMTEVGYLWRDINFQYHGAYAFLDKNGHYFTAGNNYIQGYKNQDETDPESPIVEMTDEDGKKIRWEAKKFAKNEHLVGLQITWNGKIVYVTNYGKVGALSMTLDEESNVVQLPGLDKVSLPNKMITNSFCIDSEDGLDVIYVVTSLYMNKLSIPKDKLELDVVWNTQYHEKEPELYWGRFGPGSGSSPSIVSIKAEKFIVITDGSQHMNILWINCKNGSIMSTMAVNYDTEGEGTQSEQSVVVYQDKAVVVNNWFDDEKVPEACQILKKVHDATGSLISDKMVQGCPFLLNRYAHGVSQFQFDPISSTQRQVWARDDVSCTSSIPVVSETDKIFYCIGHRDHEYTLEALSWETGEQIFFKKLGRLYNPFYAGNEVGVHGDFLIGSLLGPIRVK